MTKKEQEPNPILEGLMDRRSVTLTGPINNVSTSDVGQRLVALQLNSPEPINLIIDSGGGKIDAALSLCDLITTVLTAPVRGIVLGRCGSAATFVLLHCAERISTPYSRFLVHSGRQNEISIPIGQGTSEKLEQLLLETKAIEELVLQLYMRKLTPLTWGDGRPSEEEQRKFVLGLIDRGDQDFNDWLSAEEAREVGLVTEVVEGKLNIFRE